jgi:hypothetical protein
VVRHPLVQRIVAAYDAQDGKAASIDASAVDKGLQHGAGRGRTS